MKPLHQRKKEFLSFYQKQGRGWGRSWEGIRQKNLFLDGLFTALWYFDRELAISLRDDNDSSLVSKMICWGDDPQGEEGKSK